MSRGVSFLLLAVLAASLILNVHLFMAVRSYPSERRAEQTKETPKATFEHTEGLSNPPPASGFHGSGGPQGYEKTPNDLTINGLVLSDVQQESLFKCCTSAARRQSALAKNIDLCLAELQAELRKNMADIKKVNKLIKRICVLRTEALRSRVDAIISVKGVLSKEQLRCLVAREKARRKKALLKPLPDSEISVQGRKPTPKTRSERQ